MPDDEGNESFSKLIGDVKPLRETAERVRTAPPNANPQRRDANERSASANRFRWPDQTQRRLAATAGVSDQQLFDLARGHPEPQERIDLHGLRRDAVPRLLTQRLESAIARKLRCILVIHGQGKSVEGGESVLRERLPDWLTHSSNTKNVLAFAPAPVSLGGGGATLVLLRKRD